MTNKQKKSIVDIICLIWIIVMCLNWGIQAYKKKKNQNTRQNIVYNDEFDADEFYDDDFYDKDFFDDDINNDDFYDDDIYDDDFYVAEYAI